MAHKILQAPSLKVISQSCLQQQTQNVNGSIKNVHVVVKNHPFTIQMGLVGGDSQTNFNRLALEATLLYDSSSLEKVVDFIKVKPLEFSGRLEEGSQGLKYNLDLSVKVLSSQHEDSLFKVRLQAVNPATRQSIPGLVTYSNEILVISKPEVLRKKAEPKGTKKRTRDDQILTSLTRIESRLEELAAAGCVDKEVLLSKVSQPTASPITHVQQKLPQFESSVNNFITSFSSLTNDERPEKVRRVLRSLSSRDIENFSEVIDLFFAEGLSHHLLRGSHTAGQRSSSSLHHPLPVHNGSNEVTMRNQEVVSSPPLDFLKYEELPTLGIDSSSFELDLPSPSDKQSFGVDLSYDVSDLLLESPEQLATDYFNDSQSSSSSATNRSTLSV